MKGEQNVIKCECSISTWTYEYIDLLLEEGFPTIQSHKLHGYNFSWSVDDTNVTIEPIYVWLVTALIYNSQGTD